MFGSGGPGGRPGASSPILDFRAAIPRMAQTAKNACPACRVKFRTGGLLPSHELRRLDKAGIVDLGEPPERIDCPRCKAALRVTVVRMGTFFSTAEEGA